MLFNDPNQQNPSDEIDLSSSSASLPVAPSGELLEIKDSASYQQFLSNNSGPVLIDFSAEWCGPCKAMLPVVKEIAEDYADRALVVKIDIDKVPEAAMNYGVMSIPSFVVLKDGQEVERAIGAVSKKALEAKLDSAL